MNVEDMNDQTPLLDVRGIAKSYGDTRVLDDVTFTAGSGEFVCIVGPLAQEDNSAPGAGRSWPCGFGRFV